MLADTLVRVVTGQGYVSLYAHGLHEDQDCQGFVLREGLPLGFGIQINIPHYIYAAPISNILPPVPWLKSLLAGNYVHTNLKYTIIDTQA